MTKAGGNIVNQIHMETEDNKKPKLVRWAIFNDAGKLMPANYKVWWTDGRKLGSQNAITKQMIRETGYENADAQIVEEHQIGIIGWWVKEIKLSSVVNMTRSIIKRVRRLNKL